MLCLAKADVPWKRRANTDTQNIEIQKYRNTEAKQRVRKCFEHCRSWNVTSGQNRRSLKEESKPIPTQCATNLQHRNSISGEKQLLFQAIFYFVKTCDYKTKARPRGWANSSRVKLALQEIHNCIWTIVWFVCNGVVTTKYVRLKLIFHRLCNQAQSQLTSECVNFWFKNIQCIFFKSICLHRSVAQKCKTDCKPMQSLK